MRRQLFSEIMTGGCCANTNCSSAFFNGRGWGGVLKLCGPLFRAFQSGVRSEVICWFSQIFVFSSKDVVSSQDPMTKPGLGHCYSRLGVKHEEITLHFRNNIPEQH